MAGTAGTRFLYAAPRDWAEGSAALNAEVISGEAGTTCLAAPLSTKVWKVEMLEPSWAHLTWVELRNLSTNEMLARAGPGMEKLPCWLVVFGFWVFGRGKRKRREKSWLRFRFFVFRFSCFFFSLSQKEKRILFSPSSSPGTPRS